MPTVTVKTDKPNYTVGEIVTVDVEVSGVTGQSRTVTLTASIVMEGVEYTGTGSIVVTANAPVVTSIAVSAPGMTFTQHPELASRFTAVAA